MSMRKTRARKDRRGGDFTELWLTEEARSFAQGVDQHVALSLNLDRRRAQLFPHAIQHAALVSPERAARR